MTTLPHNQAIVSDGHSAQLQGGAASGDPNAGFEVSRTVAADGSTHIVTRNGGTVDVPPSIPTGPLPATGTATGIVGQNGQEIVRNGQGQLVPGTPPTIPAAPQSAAPTQMAAAGMPTLDAPHFTPPPAPTLSGAFAPGGISAPSVALNTGATAPTYNPQGSSAGFTPPTLPTPYPTPMQSGDFAGPTTAAGQAAVAGDAALQARGRQDTVKSAFGNAAGSFDDLNRSLTQRVTNAADNSEDFVRGIVGAAPKDRSSSTPSTPAPGQPAAPVPASQVATAPAAKPAPASPASAGSPGAGSTFDSSNPFNAQRDLYGAQPPRNPLVDDNPPVQPAAATPAVATQPVPQTDPASAQKMATDSAGAVLGTSTDTAAAQPGSAPTNPPDDQDAKMRRMASLSAGAVLGTATPASQALDRPTAASVALGSSYTGTTPGWDSAVPASKPPTIQTAADAADSTGSEDTTGNPFGKGYNPYADAPPKMPGSDNDPSNFGTIKPPTTLPTNPLGGPNDPTQPKAATPADDDDELKKQKAQPVAA